MAAGVKYEEVRQAGVATYAEPRCRIVFWSIRSPTSIGSPRPPGGGQLSTTSARPWDRAVRASPGGGARTASVKITVDRLLVGVGVGGVRRCGGTSVPDAHEELIGRKVSLIRADGVGGGDRDDRHADAQADGDRRDGRGSSVWDRARSRSASRGANGILRASRPRAEIAAGATATIPTTTVTSPRLSNTGRACSLLGLPAVTRPTPTASNNMAVSTERCTERGAGGRPPTAPS